MAGIRRDYLSQASAASTYATITALGSAEDDVKTNATDIALLQKNDTSQVSTSATNAPRGLRDTWATGGAGTAAGRYSLHAPELNLPNGLLWGFGSTNGIRYSTDGGANYSAATITSTGTHVVGWNGTLAVALGVSTAMSHSSSNGTSWTTLTVPSTVAESYNMVYFNGYFIAGCSSGGTRIMSSTNGVAWTLRTSATRQALALAKSASIVVSVGANGMMYSSDGFSWLTSSNTANCRAVCYSAERGEFLALDYTSATTYTSSDGMTWTSHSSVAASAIEAVMWVGSNINRYYYTAPDGNGNYSLFSSPDGIYPFLGNWLYGSVNAGTTFYALDYLSYLDRFLIISSASPHTYYSTKTSNLATMGKLITQSVIQQAPSVCHINNTASASVVIGASGTAQLLSATPVAYSLVRQSADFAATLATGIITYSGDTKLFRVEATICAPNGPTAADNIKYFISKNGSLVPGVRTNRTALAGTVSEVDTVTLIDTVSLAATDTIQVGILFTGTGTPSLAHQFCSILVSQL
jgi:hypothetical protein